MLLKVYFNIEQKLGENLKSNTLDQPYKGLVN